MTTNTNMTGDSVYILHVDDEPDFAEMVVDFLKRETDRFDIETATSATEGRERLAENDFDCIVSDYDMPGQNGIEFLESVREDYPDLPFILYTGKGGEEVASAAISAGVTDYLPKGAGPDQYAILANRIRNAVAEYRERRTLEQSERRLRRVYEQITYAFFTVNSNWEYTYINEESTRLVGRSKADLLGSTVWDAFPKIVDTPFEDALRTAMENQTQTSVQEYYSPHDAWYDVTVYPAEDGISIHFRDITGRKERDRRLQLERDRFRALFEKLGEPVVEVVFEGDAPLIKRVNNAFADAFGIGEEQYGESLDDAIVPERDETAARINEQAKAGKTVEREVYRGRTDVRPYLFRSAPFVGPENHQRGHGIYIDISEQKRHQQKLERQNERLEQFTSIVSHDLRNPINVAQGRLELVRDEYESEHLEAIARAHEHMETLIDDLLTLARQGEEVSELDSIELTTFIKDCWQTVATAEATLRIDVERPVRADRTRLRQLLENLIRNAIEHGGEDVRITVGERADGFYLADNGPGIPEDKREEVFKTGYSTTEDGTGFGLMIVQAVAEAHGWEVTVSESEDNGARFDITAVEFDDR